MTGVIYGLTGLLGIGIFFIVKGKRWREVPVMSVIMIGIFSGFLLLSLCISVMPQGEYIAVPGFCILIGLLLFGIVYNDIYSVLQCSQRIDATYCTFHTYHGNPYVSFCAPVFAYNYKGVCYQEQTTQVISVKKVTKQMKQGQQYPIYVNPKHPSVYIVSKRLKPDTLLCLVIGVGMFFIGIVTLL